MANHHPPLPTPPSILWPQVWGLAAVQGAIALTWVIYGLYLKSLLVDFGFPPALATLILVVENILAVGIEPLMGSLADQQQHWMSSRFPLIAAGMVLASLTFIGIPTVVIFGFEHPGWHWLLPTLMVAWALAMALFRSPALSLLGRYALASKLPQAASILTLVGGLAGALGPLANQWLLSLGPLITFTTGSLVLLGAAACLGRMNPDRCLAPPSADPDPEVPKQPHQSLRYSSLALVFGTGFSITLGFRLLMQGLPPLLKLNIPNSSPALILGSIFIALALTAIPCGALATRLGNALAMVLGLLSMALWIGIMALNTSVMVALGLAILLGLSFSLVSNGVIPLALSMVPAERGGLGTGIYFGGAALAASLFGANARQLEALLPVVGIGLSSGAFVSAAVWVALTQRGISRPSLSAR
ncbi:MFS transporter [Synechocystis sp. LKSZ1]|uniref:MFS transporter n=1 Tax=Synechocystis sp. LKSZ1 TaxID=3144951 RepID=UPI00336BEF3D